MKTFISAAGFFSAVCIAFVSVPAMSDGYARCSDENNRFPREISAERQKHHHKFYSGKRCGDDPRYNSPRDAYEYRRMLQRSDGFVTRKDYLVKKRSEMYQRYPRYSPYSHRRR